jgi:hypothetical protein
MVAINAFVAHSFTRDDEVLIGKYLKYFDQLSKSEMNFSYVHAEAAEPKVLAEKLRVCPKTSGGITKFSEHEAD